jgi:hypothetical protein
MKVKEKEMRWKDFDFFTIEMPIMRYLNKTRIGRNAGKVETISENG